MVRRDRICERRMNSVRSGLEVRFFAIVCVICLVSPFVYGDNDSRLDSSPLRIAVATNFAPVLDEIAREFTDATGIPLSVITGSTGKLYAQIKNGMAIDVFLSADQSRIGRLVKDGMTINDTLTTYAEGQLVWWEPGSHQSHDWGNRYEIRNDVRIIAHAQPKLAPYGLAAVQALSKCFQYDRSTVSFVLGENVGQAYAYVATGNADAGLVALSNIKLATPPSSDSYSSVPVTCHEPIKQDAVVLKSSQNVTGARQFLEFLHNDSIQELIAEYGYRLQ